MKIDVIIVVIFRGLFMILKGRKVVFLDIGNVFYFDLGLMSCL